MSPLSEEGRAELPGAVLFACNLNCVRSPMAAGLLRSKFAGRIFVESCGLRAGLEVDPFAVSALDELGIDLAQHRPRAFQDLDDSSFDLVVSLTPEAHHRALEFARGLAMTVVYWPTMDPSLYEGGREQRMTQYRMVRDGLERRIDDYFGRPSTFGG